VAITTYAELQTSVARELSYNPESGLFHWKRSGVGRAKRAGAEAGGMRPDGYRNICVNGKQWLCHRLAWVMFYGTKPPRVIDHIDRNKGNNAISNLRDGTNGVNELNAKVHKDSPFGISGVRAACKKGHYQAYVGRRKNGFKSLYHGPDFFEACCARKSWEANYWDNVK
jgi:hypothetical protein